MVTSHPSFCAPMVRPARDIFCNCNGGLESGPNEWKHDLFKRGLYPVNLCGWQVPQDLNYLEKDKSSRQGPSDQNVYCSSDSSCAWFTDYSVIGCCSISGSCDAVYTSCIDGKHPAQSVSYPGVLTWYIFSSNPKPRFVQ